MKHLSSKLIDDLFNFPGATITFTPSCIWRQDHNVLCVFVTQALALLTEGLFCFFKKC